MTRYLAGMLIATLAIMAAAKPYALTEYPFE